MKIDVTASLPHYYDHMLPIFEQLPERLRGNVLELETPCRYPARNRVAMVAGYIDAKRLQASNPMIYVEHGAGQAYLGDQKTATLPSYSGGASRHRSIVGYVCPSVAVAERWAPTPAVAAGCPKMDRWIFTEPKVPRSVCFAWHWDAGERRTLSPEMRSAWAHWQPVLGHLANIFRNEGWLVFGHAHPRWGGTLRKPMEAAGLTVLDTDAEVFDNVGVLFVDNSSIGYEFALLGRPTFWMNAPWYRRDVHHGLRFWDVVPGIQLDHPSDLYGLTLDEWVECAAVDAHSVVPDVYAPWSQLGEASARAAEWITELIDSKYA